MRKSFTVKFPRKLVTVICICLAAYVLFILFGLAYEYSQRDNTEVLTTNQLQLMAKEYARDGNYASAIYAAKECLRIEADNYNCLMYLGAAAYLAGDCNIATDAFSRAASLDVPDTHKLAATDLLEGMAASRVCLNSVQH